MKFLVVLLALLIERMYPTVAQWRQVERFHRYVDWFRSRFTQPWLLGRGGLVALLAPWLIGVWLLLAIFAPVAWLVALAVFLLTLGPRELFADVQRLRAELGRDGSPSEESRQAFALLDPDLQGDDLIEAVIRAAISRLFGVVFWFVLLGPAGGLLYRLSQELEAARDDQDTDFNTAVWQLQCLLDWLPARLLAATGALTGHFDATVSAWRASDPRMLFADSQRFAADVALGSMDYRDESSLPEAVEQVRDYLYRTGIVWLAVLAIMTLAGWLH